MSPRSTDPGSPRGLRRALRGLRRRAEGAISSVADGFAELSHPAPAGRPVLVPVPVRSTERPRRS